MAYKRITWVPRVLRKAGLKVIEHDGWRTRGLSTARRFEPQYVVWHHDASGEGDSPGVPSYMIRNYANAGAQLWVDRQGVWHIIATGRAAHAGATRNHVVNENSIGIETDHTTGEDWPEVQLDSLRRGTAAIFGHMKQTAADGLHFHKTICDPPGRKVDPDGLDLQAERKAVANVNPKPLPKVKLKRAKRLARRAGWARLFEGPAARSTRRRIKKALKAEGMETYRQWQAKAGVKRGKRNGVPRFRDLSQLGKRQGFQVIR